MKTETLLSPQMKKVFLRHHEHELTICNGQDAFDNLRASLAHARALLDSRRFDSVVYVNLPFSPRRFTDARREIYPKSEKSNALIVLHMAHGNLGPQFHSITETVKQAKGKVAVIINSWEFASSCYRYKEQLLFAIHALVCADDVTVFVYAQAREGSVHPGFIHRTGLGKLAAFAAGVIEIPEELEDESMTSGEKAMPTPVELLQVADESAQPLPSKIKDLRYADVKVGGGALN